MFLNKKKYTYICTYIENKIQESVTNNELIFSKHIHVYICSHNYSISRDPMGRLKKASAFCFRVYMCTENHSSDAYWIYSVLKHMNNVKNTTYPFQKCAQNLGQKGQKNIRNNSVQQISISM